MISIIMSLIASMTNMVTNIFHGTQDNKATKKVVVAQHKPNIRTNNTPITVIKPGMKMESVVVAESGVMTASKIEIESKSLTHKINTSSSTSMEVEPNDLSQYDDYAKNVNNLKRQIELNKLKIEEYKSQIDYVDPGSYDGATMIGVIVDPQGYKSARIKLLDDTVTDLQVGSRLGPYIVSSININEISLISSKCKKSKRHKHKSSHHAYKKHNLPDDDIIIHTNTENRNFDKNEENPLICKPVIIYPLYRDISNRLPINNASTKSVGGTPSNGGTRVYNNNGGTSISSGGMTLTVPPIETSQHGN